VASNGRVKYLVHLSTTNIRMNIPEVKDISRKKS
jgi:hypothetical protein